MGNPTWGDGKRAGSENEMMEAAIKDDAAIVNELFMAWCKC